MCTSEMSNFVGGINRFVKMPHDETVIDTSSTVSFYSIVGYRSICPRPIYLLQSHVVLSTKLKTVSRDRFFVAKKSFRCGSTQHETK